MMRTLALCVGWLSVSAVALSQAVPVAEPTLGRHDRAIEGARAILDERIGELPGLSVAVGLDGEIVWSQGFGWADIEQRIPVRPSSKFRVGSVAKPMTASLLALLVEEGKVDLDAPVQRYVPSFPEKRAPITTRQLAGHIAGIRHYRGDEFLSARYYGSVLEGLTIFQDDALLFEPGTDYSYSSYGWNLVSAVIEGATGESYLRQMDERVFGALGMDDTVADENRLIVLDRVRPYVRNEDGRFENAPYVDNSYKWAGGGFVSTAEDLVRFGFGHLEPGFLKAETLELLHTSQKTRDGEETGYGVGWRIWTDESGRDVVGHGGGSVGGTTRLAVYPASGLVVALITNLSDAPALSEEAIADLFLRD